MPKTKVLKINKQNPETDKIRHAAEIIKRGGLVAFPTETVYGLGASAFNIDAVRNVFKAKGRPADNPLIVHIADIKDVQLLAKRPPETAMLLMERFWPGPLTIVFKKKRSVSDIVTAGSDSVAIRMPDNKIALCLIKAAGVPLVAPSANISGKPSPTKAGDVLEDLNSRVDLIIDGGTTKIGIESTVIDITNTPPTIFRPGGITREDIESLIGKVGLIAFDPRLITPDKGSQGQASGTSINSKDIISTKTKSIGKLKSPGLKYKHYAPNAEVVIVEGDTKDVQKKIKTLVDEAWKENKKIAVISFRKNARYKNCIVVFAGADANTVARRLFGIFREMDKKKVDIIISESLTDKGIGLAVSDRLKRAANYNIIKVLS